LRARVSLSRRAEKDWKRIDAETRRRVMDQLDELAADPSGRVDARPLVGAGPWQRMRVGSWRVILRALVPNELRDFPEDRGFLVERVIRRRDLDHAVKALR
jgi:mRNA-degrading endonuclease RelE of RelBE toxin-antitoxin system